MSPTSISWSGLLVGGLKFTDTLKFEAGGGYRSDNADGAPGFSQKDDSWIVYVQAVITLAPGVYIVPEVGYYDFMDDVAGNSQGYRWLCRRQVADRLLTCLPLSTGLDRHDALHRRGASSLFLQSTSQMIPAMRWHPADGCRFSVGVHKRGD